MGRPQELFVYFQESTDTVHNSKYILIQYYFPYSRNSYTRDTGHNTFGNTLKSGSDFYTAAVFTEGQMTNIIRTKKITAFTVCEGSFYLIWIFDQIDQNGVMQISVDFWC